jgi:sigma-54 dependent transcriptional regulator, acetoin dehydrogenase operon transcriptional activator AcoR
MSAVQSPAGESTELWAQRWIEEVLASLPEAPKHERPAVAARLASMLLACARDDEADALLMGARRDAVRSKDSRELARIEIALADCALVRDDDTTAERHLASARLLLPQPPPSIATRAWLVQARIARLIGTAPPAAPSDVEPTADDPVDPDEVLELAAELTVQRAQVARERGDLAAAHVELAKAHEVVELSQSQRLIGMFELEAASFAAASGDLAHAAARFRQAIERFHEAGLRRGEGRAMIRFAEVLATSGGQVVDESAATWLGRAHQVLDVAATWRDRLAIRTGFRAFGRRVFDRVMTESTVARIESFERARGSLVNALTNIAHATDRALTDLEVGIDHDEEVAELTHRIEDVRQAARQQAGEATQAVGQLDESMRDLVELIGAALFDRDRLRVLINVLGEIDAASDEASLPPVVASLAAQLLDADRTVVAIERNGELVPAGISGEAPMGSTDEWRAPSAEATERPSARPSDPKRLSPRSGETLLGPRIAVPIRGHEVNGALYADKLRRSGQFREQDVAIAHLLAEYVALVFGRLRAREQERFALHQLAVTLDTIRDGVLSCDAQGVVASVNAAAARMLQVRPDELRGFRLDANPALAPLAAMLATSPRLDGSIVRLAHGSIVVTARPITAGDDEERGFVATLVELDRAQKIAQRLSATRARYGFHDVVGKSPSLHNAIAMARRAATIDANVLLTGESGTGKEVLAQAIHTGGPRVNEPFIGVNCAAVPRDLLEAELFGYEKGAFTSARSEGNPGKFELAAGGTILLDEIGDMPLDMQAKLLRVLQERFVTRLGGRTEIPVHARVIATTHRDLAQLVDEGKFRMDLLYRLRVLAIEVPPLRDRPEDITELGLHFLVRFAEQQRKRVRDLGPRVLDELGRYDWPGNVRELANVMEAEVSLAAPDVDVLERLATRLVGRFRTAASITSTGEWRALGTAPGLEQPIVPLAEVEKRAILHAIERSMGSVSRAAEALGVSKVTIYAKLRSWGMHPRDRNEESGEGPQSARWSFRQLPVADESAPSTPASPTAPISTPSTRRPPSRD